MWGIGSYLLGSVAMAVIVCKLAGLPDPRKVGSHNPGATNVVRIAGKKLGAITLLGDAVKGAIPILLAHSVGANEKIVACCMLAVFLGHLFPVFFQFKGGKGVATALGCLLALYWPLGLLTLCTWLIIFYTFRISSLSALITSVLIPLYGYFCLPPILWFATIFISGALLYRHKANMYRLITGIEK